MIGSQYWPRARAKSLAHELLLWWAGCATLICIGLKSFAEEFDL
jgi:hypothetical protein